MCCKLHWQRHALSLLLLLLLRMHSEQCCLGLSTVCTHVSLRIRAIFLDVDWHNSSTGLAVTVFFCLHMLSCISSTFFCLSSLRLCCYACILQHLLTLHTLLCLAPTFNWSTDSLMWCKFVLGEQAVCSMMRCMQFAYARRLSVSWEIIKFLRYQAGYREKMQVAQFGIRCGRLQHDNTRRSVWFHASLVSNIQFTT